MLCGWCLVLVPSHNERMARGSFYLVPLAVALLGVSASAQSPTVAGRPITRGKPASDGPHGVVVLDEVRLRDTRRGRTLPVKVYAPQEKGQYPVVIFSHGAGGSKDGFELLARFWATHGFVSIHPSHADAIRDGRRPASAKELLDRTIREPRAWEDRAADIRLVLDSLPQIERVSPKLQGKLDTRRIGMAGHSFGAYTAMLLGGTAIDVPNGEKDRSFADPRVTAVLAISPQGTGQQGLTLRSWRKMKLPLMTLTGSNDRGAGGQNPDWRKQPFRFSPAGDKYHVFIDGANHFSFAGEAPTAARLAQLNQARGRRFNFRPGAGGEPSDIFNAVKHATLHYWKAYLQGDAEAREYLRSDQLVTDTGGRATLERR